MQNSSVEDTNYNCNPIKINGILMDFDVPKVMGILNVTADSFYENSRINSDNELLKKAEQHLSEGATLLDLGGFSTRPGAISVDEKSELIRVQLAVQRLKKAFPEAILSVDTFRASVAQAAIDEGVAIINDISGFQFDEKLLEVIANNEVTYVLMHVEGTFETMHETHRAVSQYGDMTQKVSNYFSEKLAILSDKGVHNVILDPGFGFSKTMEENYEVLHNFERFHSFKKPLLAGISRKSMIYKKLGISPEESLNGTTTLNTVAILKGAGIVRVHDVKACVEIIDLLKK